MAWNAENQLKCPFFLQVYETHFSERVKQDKYDIKEYIQAMGKAQEMLEKYSLKEHMASCEVAELIRVSPPEVKSRHVIICIHGFLMQNDDQKKLWAEVADYYKFCEVYALRWTSTAPEQFLDAGVFSKGLSTILSKVQRVANWYNTGKQQYAFAYDQGMLTGYILAYALLNTDIVSGKAVSLIGYSAGSVVEFSCCRAM